MLTSLFQSMYSLVDILVAGNYVGSRGISAINNSSLVILLITKIAIGITQGGNIIIGQYFGAGEEKKKREAIGTLTLLSIVLGIISMIVFYFGAEWILIRLKAPALQEAKEYLQICAIGLGFVWLYNALSGILRAMGNSRMPMNCIIVSTLLNIVLDFLFVGGFSMGTAGAAYATVFSQIVSCVIAFVYLFLNRQIFSFQLSNMKIRLNEMKKIFRLGIPSAIQMTIAGFSWLFVTYMINQYGVDVSAGNGISIKIKDTCQLLLSAMNLASSTMIAQNLGAKKYDRVMVIVNTAIKINLILALCTIVICQIFGGAMVGFFTNNVAAAAAGTLNLRIEIFGQIFYAIFLIYNSLSIGAGQSEFAMFNSFMNCIVVRIVLCYIFDKIWGLTGIYIACMAATFVSCPIGWIYAKSGCWKRDIVH
ncbi:MAG TPA: MATE family efflux transporter [Candidatus Fimousia stercorigallinarum]|nr:MATE family efflux transporter [Candidatus Fimousia stercorigallinarum]